MDISKNKTGAQQRARGLSQRLNKIRKQYTTEIRAPSGSRDRKGLKTVGNPKELHRVRLGRSLIVATINPREHDGERV